MFGFFGKSSGMKIAESNLKEEFGLTLNKIPTNESIIEEFERMNKEQPLSPEAQTSLLYRLVVLNYLARCKILQDNGSNIERDNILWLTDISDSAVDWSQKSRDHVVLETLTSNLNLTILRYFNLFGINTERK